MQYRDNDPNPLVKVYLCALRLWAGEGPGEAPASAGWELNLLYLSAYKYYSSIGKTIQTYDKKDQYWIWYFSGHPDWCLLHQQSPNQTTEGDMDRHSLHEHAQGTAPEVYIISFES